MEDEETGVLAVLSQSMSAYLLPGVLSPLPPSFAMAILAKSTLLSKGGHFLYASGSILEVSQYHLLGSCVSGEHTKVKLFPAQCYILFL